MLLKKILKPSKSQTTEKILVIDFSATPCQSVIIEASKDSFTILERHSFPYSGDALIYSAENLETETSNLSVGQELVEDVELANAVGSFEAINTDTKSNYLSATTDNQLLELRHELLNEWDTACIIISPKNFITLNLTLPFKSKKDINQVISGEIQEQLPLNIDEYHIQYDVRGKFKEDLTEVRAQLIELNVMRTLLEKLKDAGIDPSVITTPGTILPLLLSATEHTSDERPHGLILVQTNQLLNSDYFGNEHEHSHSVYLTIFAQGSYRSEHHFVANNDLLEVIPEIKRTLLWAANRYKIELGNIYCLCSSSQREHLEKKLPYSIVPITMPPTIPSEQMLAIFAGLSAREEAPFKIAGNFRTGRFGVNPLLNYLLTQIKHLVPHLIICFLLVVVMTGSVYAFRQYQINSYQNAIRNKISTIDPTLVSPSFSGSVLEQTALLKGRIKQFQDQVQAMSIFSDLTPLHVIGLISKYLPQEKDVEVTNISIDGHLVILRGNAPDHSTVEKLKRGLKKNDRTFCKLKKQRASKNSQRSIAFEFTFEICEG